MGPFGNHEDSYPPLNKQQPSFPKWQRKIRMDGPRPHPLRACWWFMLVFIGFHPSHLVRNGTRPTVSAVLTAIPQPEARHVQHEALPLPSTNMGLSTNKTHGFRVSGKQGFHQMSRVSPDRIGTLRHGSDPTWSASLGLVAWRTRFPNHSPCV